MMDPNSVLRQVKLPTEAQEDPEKYRFQVELEFVQCLANPQYLNFLAQRGYFKEKEFINYLGYLQYWKKQEYAKYLKNGSSSQDSPTLITRPLSSFLSLVVQKVTGSSCLHFLDLLQLDQFRRELANAQCTKFIEEQQLLHWHHYTKRRTEFQQRIMTQGKQPPVAK